MSMGVGVTVWPPNVFVPVAAICVGVTVCLSVVSVFSSHCSDLVVLWGVLAQCPSDMFLPSGLVGQDTLSRGALQTRHECRNIQFCLEQPLGVVVIANFSLSYTNPGPTLKVCLPVTLPRGNLWFGVLGLARRGQKLLK